MKNSDPPQISPATGARSHVVVGRGRLGRSLAAALGCPLLPGHDAKTLPDGSLCLIAVPDQHIAAVAARLEGRNCAGVHLSGACDLEPLSPLAARGWETGSFHPMQSFPAVRGAEAFRHSFFAIDGNSESLCAQLERLATQLGGFCARVPGARRAAYHAAATMAGPLVVALVSLAVRQFARAGLEPEQALDALQPYLAGTLANLAEQRLPGALIGPVRRGDRATVARHLGALAPSARAAYLALSLEALAMSREAGLDSTEADALQELLARPPAMDAD